MFSTLNCFIRLLGKPNCVQDSSKNENGKFHIFLRKNLRCNKFRKRNCVKKQKKRGNMGNARKKTFLSGTLPMHFLGTGILTSTWICNLCIYSVPYLSFDWNWNRGIMEGNSKLRWTNQLLLVYNLKKRVRRGSNIIRFSLLMKELENFVGDCWFYVALPPLWVQTGYLFFGIKVFLNKPCIVYIRMGRGSWLSSPSIFCPCLQAQVICFRSDWNLSLRHKLWYLRILCIITF